MFRCTCCLKIKNSLVACKALLRSVTCFPLCSQSLSFIQIQTGTEKLAVSKTLKESAACFCFVRKVFRITDTKQLPACGTWTAIKPRDLKAMKNTRAGPGHGGGTPPARTGLPVRGKAGNNRSGRACSSLAVFPAFHCALGPSCCHVPKSSSGTLLDLHANPVPQEWGPGGSSPWWG